MPDDQYDKDVKVLLERIAVALESIATNTLPHQDATPAAAVTQGG